MRTKLDACLHAVNQVLLGKEPQVRLALACLLARGHLLIEDIPGVGKTTLAHALARTLGLVYQRIQFTSDLLPADIIGVSVFEPEGGQFRFHRGPVFAQLVLADEVNRATPKAQSALLEAMEEHQVTADGNTYPMTEPFFVIATQNPVYQVGTFPLPESQLDRFLMRIELGYPQDALERQLLLGQDRRDLLATLVPALAPQQLLRLQRDLFFELTGHYKLASQTTKGSVFVHRAAYTGWEISRPYNVFPIERQTRRDGVAKSVTW